MLYFSVLALSILTVLVLGILTAFVVRYPREWTSLTDSEIDHLLSKGVIDDSVRRWFTERELGRFAKVCFGAMFVISIISTAVMLRGPE